MGDWPNGPYLGVMYELLVVLHILSAMVWLGGRVCSDAELQESQACQALGGVAVLAVALILVESHQGEPAVGA